MQAATKDDVAARYLSKVDAFLGDRGGDADGRRDHIRHRIGDAHLRSAGRERHWLAECGCEAIGPGAGGDQQQRRSAARAAHRLDREVFAGLLHVEHIGVFEHGRARPSRRAGEGRCGQARVGVAVDRGERPGDHLRTEEAEAAAQAVAVQDLEVEAERLGIEQIIEAPANDYTRSLLAAAQPLARLAGYEQRPAGVPLLEIKSLVAGYGACDAAGQPKSLVLDDINLRLFRGQSIGVIGESGSGKTTLARVVAGLLAPARGELLFDGQPLPPTLQRRSKEQLRRIQIVFQMADTALNPAHSVARIPARPLTFYRGLSGAPLKQRIRQLLDLVQLPAGTAERLPGGLSGGQKQRVNLARALAAEPDLILCDEVTSALDTVVGAAILDLMADLRRELGVSYMFISHDLNTVRAVCDEIVLMYTGRKVESAPRRAFEFAPATPISSCSPARCPSSGAAGSTRSAPNTSPRRRRRPGHRRHRPPARSSNAARCA